MNAQAFEKLVKQASKLNQERQIKAGQFDYRFDCAGYRVLISFNRN